MDQQFDGIEWEGQVVERNKPCRGGGHLFSQSSRTEVGRGRESNRGHIVRPSALPWTTKVIDSALRNAGAMKRPAIRGGQFGRRYHHAYTAAKVPKKAATQNPTTKSKAGVGELHSQVSLTAPPRKRLVASLLGSRAVLLRRSLRGRTPKVPPLRSTNARDAINEITEIVAKTTGDGATKAAS